MLGRVDWDERKQELTFLSGVTILCTGGCGLVYCTAPTSVATGDRVAIVLPGENLQHGIYPVSSTALFRKIRQAFPDF